MKNEADVGNSHPRVSFADETADQKRVAPAAGVLAAEASGDLHEQVAFFWRAWLPRPAWRAGPTGTG